MQHQIEAKIGFGILESWNLNELPLNLFMPSTLKPQFFNCTPAGGLALEFQLISGIAIILESCSVFLPRRFHQEDDKVRFATSFFSSDNSMHIKCASKMRS